MTDFAVVAFTSIIPGSANEPITDMALFCRSYKRCQNIERRHL